MSTFSTLIATTVWKIITTINHEQGQSCSLLVVSQTVNDSLTIDLALESMQTHSMPMIFVIDPENYETIKVRDSYIGWSYSFPDGYVEYL